MTLENPDEVYFGTDAAPAEEGNVLVLNYHHDGESHWCTPEQARARIESILDGNKPEEEWGPRMEAMKVVPYGAWRNSKALSEAWTVYKKALSEAWAVYEKASSEARTVYDKARFEAWDVYGKARFEAWAVYEKATSEAGAVYGKATSEAGAVYGKAGFETWPVVYPAEPWAARAFDSPEAK